MPDGLPRIAEDEYGGFISYRRGGADERVARKLHRLLESYRTPRRLVAHGIPSRVGHVFLDTADREASSDLDTQLAEALARSRWLLVVCTPRVRDPGCWVEREVERFLETGRREGVLPLLLEGEPEEAFPVALLSGPEARAGDIRAETLRASLRKLRHEKLALLAPMLGVKYDDLRRRELQRVRRRRLGMASAGVLLAILAVWLLGEMRFQRRRSQVFALVEAAERATSQGEHEQGALLALRGLHLERSHRLGLAHEAERAVRAAFAEPWFRCPLPGEERAPRALAASADGRYVSGAFEDALAVWDLNAREAPPRRVPLEGGRITALAFSRTGYELGLATAEGRLVLLDLAADRTREVSLGHARLEQLVFAPERDRIVVGDENGVLHVLDREGSPRDRLDCESKVLDLAVSADGNWLAAVTPRLLWVWRWTESGLEQSTRTKPPSGTFRSLAFHPGSSRLVTTSAGFVEGGQRRATVQVCSVANSWEEPTEVLACEDETLRVRFTEDGTLLVAGPRTALHFAQLEPDRSACPSPASRVSTFELVPERSALVAVSSETGKVELVHLPASVRAPRLLEEPSGPVQDLAFCRGGSSLVVAHGGESAVFRWDLRPEAAERTTLGHVSQPFEPRPSSIASGISAPHELVVGRGSIPTVPGDVLLWTLADDSASVRTVIDGCGDVRDVSTTTDGKLVACADSAGGFVRIRDLVRGTTTEHAIGSQSTLPQTLDVRPGKRPVEVAVGDQLGNVYLLRPSTGEVMLVAPSEAGASAHAADWSLRYSADGRRLVAGGPGQVRLFRVEEGLRLSPVPLASSREGALCAVFSPDSADLLAGFRDGGLLRWDLGDPRNAPYVLRDAGPAVTAVAYAPSGDVLAAGFADGEVRTWPRFGPLLDAGLALLGWSLAELPWQP